MKCVLFSEPNIDIILCYVLNRNLILYQIFHIFLTMLRLCFLRCSAKGKFSSAYDLFNTQIAKTLAQKYTPTDQAVKKVPKSFFVEHKNENYYYYGLYVGNPKQHIGQVTNEPDVLDVFQSACAVFDCPFTKRLLQTQMNTPIYLRHENAMGRPTANDICILFLRYPRRYARSMQEIAKNTMLNRNEMGSKPLGVIVDDLSDAEGHGNERLKFFYQAYLLALRILFPEAYSSLIESNFQLAQEDFSESLIYSLNLLSETCLLKKNCKMGYFYVIHNLVSLFKKGITEEIKKIQSHADFEQCVRQLKSSSTNCVVLSTVFSDKEVEWTLCNVPLYISCIHIDAITDGQSERTTIATLTPSPFLSWHNIYVEALKHINIGMYHAYNTFIDDEKALKLSPALNSLGCITLFLKQFYGRKLIAVTNCENRELRCNLMYLVERDLTDRIIKLENLEQRGTAMTFFSFSTKTKKEAIKQCALLAVVTFFPQMFRAVQELDWYNKSSPIVAGSSIVSCPNHSITTEVYHSNQSAATWTDPSQQSSSHNMVSMLDELFKKETDSLPETLKEAKITSSVEKIKMNLSTFYVVRIIARKPLNALSTQEAIGDIPSEVSLDFFSDEDSPCSNAGNTSTQDRQIQIAQVISKSKSSGTLQACCMVVQSYFPSHLDVFARYVLINQEKSYLEERNALKGRDKSSRSGATNQTNDHRPNPDEEFRTHLESKEPIIQSTLESIRESLSDRESLNAIIHNLFILNRKRPLLQKSRENANTDKLDNGSNLSIFRTCVQKAARLNLRPLMESVSDITPLDSYGTCKATKVALRTIGDKTIIESSTSQYPLKSMLTLYKFLSTESEFCLKHIKLEFVRSLIAVKPFANVPIVQLNIGSNILCMSGLESLVRALMQSQYGYELQVVLDEEGYAEGALGSSVWKSHCLVASSASFLENGEEKLKQSLDAMSPHTALAVAGITDFSASKTKGKDSGSLIASAYSTQSRKHCLWKLYSAVILQLFPEMYAEVVLKSESEGMSAAAEVIHDVQSEQSIHTAAVSVCTSDLPIAAHDSCHLTNLRMAFVLVAKFLPMEEVVQVNKIFKASLYKTSESGRLLLIEVESTSKIHAVFKAYEALCGSLGFTQIASIRNALDGNGATEPTGPLITVQENSGKNVGNLKPMLELYHRINENLIYSPGSRSLPESLLEYGLKLQYGIELMIGTNKTDNTWTTMLYGVLTHRTHAASEKEVDTSSLWDKEWNVSPQAADISVKRIFLVGCKCHTKSNSLKMACIHVMKTALPSFYALTPTLSSWQTPTDFIELIESEDE